MEGILDSRRKRLTLHASDCPILTSFKTTPSAREEISFVAVQVADLDKYKAKGNAIADRCPCLKPPKPLPLPHREDPA